MVHQFINMKFSKTKLPKMIHSDGVSADILVAIPQVMFQTGEKTKKKRKRNKKISNISRIS